MSERSISDSFILRIYRYDPSDPRKLTGLVETVDGGAERFPFTDIDELAAILNRCVGRQRKRRGRSIEPG
jgi:hypothetical protein